MIYPCSLYSPIVTATLAFLDSGGSVKADKEQDSNERLTNIHDGLPITGLEDVEIKIESKFGTLDFEYDASDNDWTTVEEVLYNLDQLVKAGKIRYAGLSNETPWGVMKYIQISKEKNLPRMMSIQNVYSLVNRVFDIHNSEVSIRESCGLLAYSPLAGGRLSGKYIGGKNPQKARYTLWPRRFSRHHTERGEKAIEKYFKLAQKHNIAPSTFANAFVNDRPFVTSNIIGATTMDQLKENIDSIDISLSKELLKEIEDIHLSDPNPCV